MDEYPDNWDETLFYTALQILRSDPSSAHGYAPGALLLGRPLVYPMELDKKDINFEGSYQIKIYNNGAYNITLVENMHLNLN